MVIGFSSPQNLPCHRDGMRPENLLGRRAERVPQYLSSPACWWGAKAFNLKQAYSNSSAGCLCWSLCPQMQSLFLTILQLRPLPSAVLTIWKGDILSQHQTRLKTPASWRLFLRSCTSLDNWDNLQNEEKEEKKKNELKDMLGTKEFAFCLKDLLLTKSGFREK